MNTALTIAGTDSGGGAGIQADLRAFAHFGVWGTSAVTCVTAQSPKKITRIVPVEAAMLQEQIAAVCRFYRVDAIKIGMTYSETLVETTTRALDLFAPDIPIVLDPITRATSGRRLLEGGGEAALVGLLLPRARVVTPNLVEAALLAGMEEVADVAGMEEAARRIASRTRATVVVTGGHLDDRPIDLVLTEGHVHLLDCERVATPTHGTGCSFSAALAASLACGEDVVGSARAAKEYVGALLKARL